MPEDSMIGRYLAARERAVAIGDQGLVNECDFNLNRLGYRPEQPSSVARAEATAEAEARPAGSRKAKRTES